MVFQAYGVMPPATAAPSSLHVYPTLTHPLKPEKIPTTVCATPVQRTVIEGTPVVELVQEAGVNERKCTDTQALVLFLIFLLYAHYLAISTIISGGGVARLTHSVNFSGKICGASPGMAAQPYLYYPLDVSNGMLHKEVKVLPGARRCLKSCPTSEDVKQRKVIPITRTQIDRAPLGTTSTLVEYYVYTPVYATIPVAGRLCYPSDSAVALQLSQHVLTRPLITYRAALGGISTAYPVILLSAVVSLGLSIFYTWSFKVCPKLALMTSAFVAVIASCFLGSGFLYDAVAPAAHKVASTLYRFPAETVLSFAFGVILLLGALALVVLLITMRDLYPVVARVFDACADVAWDRGGGLLASPTVMSLVTMILGWCWLLIFLQLSAFSTGSQVAMPLSPDRNGSVTVLSAERQDAFSFRAFFCSIVWIAVGLWCFEFIGCLSKFSVCYTGTMWYFRRLSHEYYAKSWTHPVFLNNHLEKSAVTPSLVSLYIGLMNHAGSFAKGALAFCLTRPCRLFNAWVSPGYFSLYPQDHRSSPLWVAASPTANGFVEMSLASTSFVTSMLNAANRQRAGKSTASRFLGLAQLGTSMALFSTILIAGLITHSILTRQSEYTDILSPYYIPSRLTLVLISMATAGCVVYPQLSCWAVLSDALFYCYVLETSQDELGGAFREPKERLYAPPALKGLLSNEFDEIVY